MSPNSLNGCPVGTDDQALLVWQGSPLGPLSRAAASSFVIKLWEHLGLWQGRSRCVRSSASPDPCNTATACMHFMNFPYARYHLSRMDGAVPPALGSCISTEKQPLSTPEDIRALSLPPLEHEVFPGLQYSDPSILPNGEQQPVGSGTLM